MRFDVTIDLSDGGSLRPLREQDVTEAYIQGLNDREVNAFLVGPRSAVQNRQSVSDFVKTNLSDPAALLFGIFIEGILRGTVRLHDIDRPHGTGTVGLALFDKSVWGLGWGTRILRAICRFATTTLKLREVRAAIEDENERSKRTFAKAGFVADGPIYRDAIGRSLQYWAWRSTEAA